jgi:hypothetical protein
VPSSQGICHKGRLLPPTLLCCPKQTSAVASEWILEPDQECFSKQGLVRVGESLLLRGDREAYWIQASGQW